MIQAIFSVVAPVFLIIGAGYVAARAGRIGPEATDALLSFVIRFAVPTLLFEKIYNLDLSRAFSPATLVAFYAGAFASFFLGVLLARALGRRPGEQVAIGFCAFFSNTLLLGLPIMERAYCPTGLAPEAAKAACSAALDPMFGVIALHAPLLYTFGMVAMEVARHDGAGAAVALRRAAKNIASNGLTIGIAIGMAFNLLGVTLPQAASDAVALFVGAAVPAALFAVGAALTRFRLRDDLALAAGVAAISLVAHPAIAYALAFGVFDLPIEFARAAVVTAAMPSGMNVYIFAAMYERAEGAAASALLLATAASLGTISFWLAILGGVTAPP